MIVPGLSGKRALVTVAGRCLGRAIAAALTRSGALVAVNDLSRDVPNDLAGKAYLPADVGSHAEAVALAAAAEKALGGPLDILVNNAGILRDAMLAKMTEDDFDAVIRVNLKGVFNAGQAFVRALESAGRGGAIVNVASVSAYGNIGQSNYSAAKAGVIGLTHTWALELAKKGIRVNAVAPGLIDTDMTRGIPAPVKEKLAHAIPLKRLGQPQDVAAVVAFLSSDMAAYVTGAVVPVDGGASVGGL